MEKDVCRNGVALISLLLPYYGCSTSASEYGKYMFVVFRFPAYDAERFGLLNLFNVYIKGTELFAC
jgi:hypothetical protein